METVHITQFYNCTKVALAAELQYIIELGKYLVMDYNKVLSVDGVLFDNILMRSKFWDYFRMAVEKGWIVNVADDVDIDVNKQFPINYEEKISNVHFVEVDVPYNPEDKKKRNEDPIYNYTTPKDMQVCFTEKSDDFWSWVLYGVEPKDYTLNINALSSSGAEMRWVSFIAYVAVNRFIHGTPHKLLITLSSSTVRVPNILTYFILLAEKTDCFRGWCHATYDDDVIDVERNNLSYTAWYKEGIDLGYHDKSYSVDEKMNHMKELDIREGDVIGLYKRNIDQELNYIKSIASFKIAIVRGIHKDGLDIQIIHTKKTKRQGEIDYADFNMATKKMYDFNNPFLKVNTSREYFSWIDVGIEHMLYSELTFITPLYDDDLILMNVDNGKGGSECAWLSANNLTYWIMKDFNIKFNEERFLERYFGNHEPLYKIYHETGEMPKQYIYDGN